MCNQLIPHVRNKESQVRMQYLTVALGGLVVACLPLEPRFASSNAAEGDGFLRAIKISSVKPSVPCREILRQVKKPYGYERDTS
jgi:hypothetical protein